MAFWDGLLGGGSSDPLDIYGDLFSEKQKAALQQRSAGEGLLKLAGAFGQAAQPSRMPTSFMGALGQAAGAMAGSGDEAAKTALTGMKTAEDVRASRVKRAGQERYRQIVEAALRASGVDPASPQGQLAVDQALTTPPDAPPGAPQPPGAPPPLNAYGMPQPRDNTAFGIPPRPGQPPLTPAPALAPPPPGQQNTGLLPAQDQVVGPDGLPGLDPGALQGPGVLAALAAGGGAPPPFQRASSTPTGAAAPMAGGPRSQAIDYFTRQGWTPAQAAGIAANLEHESSWRADVSGDGGKAFGYGQWHPPRQENFKRVFGKDIRQSSPQEQLAFVNWELNNTEKAAGDRLRGAASPRDAAAIVSRHYERPADAEGNAARRGSLAEKINGGGQDVVIPSGRGVPASALQNVADTGGGGGAPGGAGQVIPGLNLTPQQLGLLNALGKLNDIDSPFDSLLDTYYKSPGYLGEKARTEATAQKEVGLKYDPQIEAAKAAATQKYIQENETHKSGLDLARDLIGKGVYLDKATGTMKPITNAAEAMAAIEAAKPTGDIKEYNFYAQQEAQRGGIPKPFEVWDRERRKASATSINTTEGFEAAQLRARLEVDKKIAIDANEKALAARQIMPLLDEALTIARKTPEGLAGPASASFGRMAAAFGIPVPPGSSNAELLGAINQRLIPLVREPGATAASEMDRYLAAGPALMGTADGRVKIAEMTKAMGQRAIEIGKVYRAHIGKADLDEKLAELDRPLFTDEQRAAMEAVTKPAGDVPTGAAPTGQFYQGKPVYKMPDGSLKVMQ